MIVNIDICPRWRRWPLSPLGLLLLPEVLHVILRHPWRGVGDVPQDDHRPPLLDVLGPDAVCHLVSGVPVHAQGVTSPDGNLGQGRAYSNGLEVKLKRNELKLNLKPSAPHNVNYLIKAHFASKREVRVTEEADSDDGSAEQLRGVDVGHDAASRHVVIDHG